VYQIQTMISTTPRISICPNEIRNYNKVLRSCMFSRQIYFDVSKRNVIVHRYGTSVYVCFKGCSSLNDFITSVDIRNCRIHGDSVGIHNGFCERQKSLRHEVSYGILKNCMSHHITDVVFTGHSAGGSLAQIGALFLHDSLDKDISAHCYTFGSPKTGDECFKDAIEQTIGDNLLRIETYKDIVCLLPMQPRFKHVGKALILDNNSKVFKWNTTSFFEKYHGEYIEFVKEMKANNLMNKETISEMLEAHSCDSYSNNVFKVVDNMLL